MPKGLTQEEIDTIKEELLIKGKELFAQYGYKKLGIRDVTTQIGISTGMFYKFFSSKKELFFIIVEKEREYIREKIFNEMVSYRDNPKEALKSFYYIIIKELQNNPLMKTVLVKDEYSSITSHMTEEELIKEREKSLEQIKELTQYWKDKELIKDIDLNIVIESLRSLVYLWFHKEEIGEDRYPIIIKFIVDQVCDYIEV